MCACVVGYSFLSSLSLSVCVCVCARACLSRSADERVQDAAGPYAGEITSVVEEEERVMVKVKWFLNSREGGPYLIPNRWETESAQDFVLMAADAKLIKKTERFQERIVQDEYDAKMQSIRLAGRWQSLQAAWVDHCKVLLEEELSLIRADVLKLKEQRALEEEMKKAEAQSHAAKHVVVLKGVVTRSGSSPGMREKMLQLRKEKAEREAAAKAKREEEERKRLEKEAQKAEIRARQMALLEAQVMGPSYVRQLWFVGIFPLRLAPSLSHTAFSPCTASIVSAGIVPKKKIQGDCASKAGDRNQVSSDRRRRPVAGPLPCVLPQA